MMKKKHIMYIGAALLLAGCADEDGLSANGTLSGDGKTPLVVEATLGTGNGVTRAEGKKFETGDQLLVYLRHTTGPEAGDPSVYHTITADQAPCLVTLTMTADAEATTGTVTETSTFNASYTGTGSIGTVTTLYWDDFSDSRSADTDLRTDGHGLQSYYGYCYNGGDSYTVNETSKSNISSALGEETGALGWTIETDQSASAAVKRCDLLWSAEQPTVAYDHDDKRENPTNGHGTLTIPFTHAMSQVTVTVTAADGFTGTPLTTTGLTLNGMNTVAALTASTGTFSSASPATVTMFAEAYNTGSTPLKRDYTAIVAPGTKLLEGTKLLDITGVDDNDYTVTITSNMLADVDGWGAGHSDSSSPVQKGIETIDAKNYKYVITQPGVNYHLTVTVKKTEIQTRATLADWRTVNATGTGNIVYDDDETEETLVMDDGTVDGNNKPVTVVAVDQNLFANGASFSLFQLLANSSSDEANERTNAAYDFATVSTFQNRDNTTAEQLKDEWTNSPEIFWPNKTNNYYFRALAQFNSATEGVNSITSVGTYNSDKGTAVSQGYITEGHDILWGTTAKHKGISTNKTYESGHPIPPRTGDVPIAFVHAMSKVTFTLETTNDATVTVNNAKVDLTGATIAISNLYTSGTINIEDGEIERAASKTAAALTATAWPVSELIVVPQSLVDNDTDTANDAWLTVTLADGTTYKKLLSECVETGTKTSITQWERGKHYQYTIHLEKEQIQFRALIKDWEPVSGSGNANLEWD